MRFALIGGAHFFMLKKKVLRMFNSFGHVEEKPYLCSGKSESVEIEANEMDLNYFLKKV